MATFIARVSGGLRALSRSTVVVTSSRLTLRGPFVVGVVCVPWAMLISRSCRQLADSQEYLWLMLTQDKCNFEDRASLMSICVNSSLNYPILSYPDEAISVVMSTQHPFKYQESVLQNIVLSPHEVIPPIQHTFHGTLLWIEIQLFTERCELEREHTEDE